MTPPDLPEGHALHPTSALLMSLIDSVPRPRVSAGWLLGRLRRRAFGFLLLALGMLALVPGIATLAGILLILPALQLAVGHKLPGLPRRVLALTAPSTWFTGRFAHLLVRWVERLERLVRPRWMVMTEAPVANLAGIVLLLLALAILAPVPFLHIIPALAVIVIALGLLEHDGVTLVIGLAFGGIIVAAGAFVWVAILWAVLHLFGLAA